MSPERRVRVLLTNSILVELARSVDVFPESGRVQILSRNGDQIVDADVHGLHFDDPRPRSKVVLEFLEGLQTNERWLRGRRQLGLELLHDSDFSARNHGENDVLRTPARIHVAQYDVMHRIFLDVDVDNHDRLQVTEVCVSHSREIREGFLIAALTNHVPRGGSVILDFVLELRRTNEASRSDFSMQFNASGC